MNKKRFSITSGLIAFSAFVGWEVRPVDMANFAQDETTIIRKNIDKSCIYGIHENTLIAICPINTVDITSKDKKHQEKQ